MFLLTLYHLSNIVKTQRKSVGFFTGGSKMPESICIYNSYSNITMDHRVKIFGNHGKSSHKKYSYDISKLVHPPLKSYQHG